MKRIALTQHTLKIIEDGYYLSSEGKQVNLDRQLASCIAGTAYYEPEALLAIEQDVLSGTPQFSNTEFMVRNETTLVGAERTARSHKFAKIAVLNFASAKNPGGGFIKGAKAQEESLARSSALYKSLLKCPQYYEYHRSHKSLLYSDRLIYSPGCPVFRKDDGTLLDEPYLVDFITSSAPNAGQIWRQESESREKIRKTLYGRGAKLLALALNKGCEAIVLGAWGCGVFRNDPSMVAQMFADFLLSNGQFAGRFKSVIFSVLDSSDQRKTFAEFNSLFRSN
ncbi:TIGR02452 family protein [Tychonema sp. LEGE 07203]|uniref:TIGR02452 family protein n=1 Tax=Tychonema sp. LEGE 07203 TaxID=1828671 RepID=UPI001881C454|nr:TIGR02452 family protein [Tychonema sp. LEGE 07203]MBE9094040.1 TIGR02452 family protein [Tychonema sp. LEGE 07203]